MKQKESDWARISGKGLYPSRLSWALLLPLRNLIFSPKKLAKRLHLQENWKVLELGCGPGYFSPYIARRLTKGRLFLTDVQEEMLRKAKKRLAKFKVLNATIQLTDGKVLPYSSEKFDCIFLVTVLGEIQHQDAMLDEIYRITKPNGLLSITEMAGDPDAFTQEEVRAIIESAGFSFVERFGKKRNFTLNFKRNG